MSDSFSTILVQDPRLLVTDSIQYAVQKGGQNVTEATFNAISASASQIVFNIAVPSENTIIDRRVYLKTTVNFNITITNVLRNTNYFKLGVSDGLQAFPLQRSMSTITATINNTTVALNAQDLIDVILLMNENEDLYRYHGMTPAIPDCAYLSYDQIGANYNNNILAGFQLNSLNGDWASRGSFPISVYKVTRNGVEIPVNYAFTSANAAEGEGTYVLSCYATLVEPLIISPFLFGNSTTSCQGIYGIQNMNFSFNVGALNRFFSSANPNLSVALNTTSPFIGTQMYMTFITPQPSQLLKTRNVVPFYQLFRYISTQGGANTISTISPSTYNPNQTAYSIPGIVATQATYTSSTIQLNSIPDLLIIIIRPQLSTQTPQNSASFLVINKISINFANCAGLLSNATQYDLYRMSVENGSSQTWDQFSGWAMTTLNNKTFPIPTTGSMLVLKFGKDIQLSTDYWAPGSLGNFSLNYTITVTNQGTNYANAAGEYPYTAPLRSVYFPTTAGDGVITPEIVTVTMDSGAFVCSAGTANVYTGLLSKENVLQASTQPPYTGTDVDRLVGGSISDKINSSIGAILHRKGHHRPMLMGGIGTGVSGGSLGMGTSGGGIGTGVSGGKLSRHMRS